MLVQCTHHLFDHTWYSALVPSMLSLDSLAFLISEQVCNIMLIPIGYSSHQVRSAYVIDIDMILHCPGFKN